MSEHTKYQEGVLILSNGKQIPFLCPPLSKVLAPEDLEELAIADIRLMPEVDRAVELKSEILRDQLGQAGGDPEAEPPSPADLDDDLQQGFDWDGAF